MANPLQMRCELISSDVEEKNIHLHDKKAGEIKEKSLFRRIINLIASDEGVNFSASLNLAASKKHERCPKNQNRKEKLIKLVSLRDIAMMYYGIPER